MEIKGFFEQGDFFEISGGQIIEVVHADENVFWARRIRVLDEGLFMRDTCVKMYSNKPSHFEGKYWIVKVPSIKSFVEPKPHLL